MTRAQIEKLKDIFCKLEGLARFDNKNLYKRQDVLLDDVLEGLKDIIRGLKLTK